MKRYAPVILLLACATALILGIVQLFFLRFEVGDVYPAYSSLRSDPLGTMAFYESLDQLPGLAVQRDLSAQNRLPDGPETTYLHLAASSYGWVFPEETFKEIERFATSGGRFVITLLPESSNSRRKPQEPESRSRDRAEQESKGISLSDRWGVNFEIIDLKQGDRSVYEPVQVQRTGRLSLPETLDWHSGIVLSNSNPAWNPIYTRETKAVVVERTFGRGAIVIATDSFFVSNEAMRQDRRTELLVWLIGPSRNVIFDEAHLGVTERPGMATLMRKYRLHWLVGALVVLAGLFIWKNSVSLVPLPAEQEAEHHVVGKDAAAGFVNLLRRSIPTRDLLAACFMEWKKSAAQTGQYSAARIRQAEAAFEAENSLVAKDRDCVRTYQAISRILKTRIR